MPAKVMVPRTGHTPGRLRELAPGHRFHGCRHRRRAIARVMEDTLSRAETAAGGRALRMQPGGALTSMQPREPALLGMSLPTMQRAPKEA